MKRDWHIALVVVLALTVQGLGLCTGDAAGCAAPACTAQQPAGCCDRSLRHTGSQSSHAGCVSANCLSGVALIADTDAPVSEASHAFPILYLLPAITSTESSTRLETLTSVPRLPDHIPIFLSLNALLI